MEPLLPVVDTRLEHDAYRVMMFCIGAVVRKGDRRQKATLLTVLRRQLTVLEHLDMSRARSDTSQRTASARKYPQQAEHLVDDFDMSGADLGRYATALKQDSDKRGLLPAYDVEELSQIPPRFRAMITLEGSTYTGTAKTKKQARHKAARQACSDRDIQV